MTVLTLDIFINTSVFPMIGRKFKYLFVLILIFSVYFFYSLLIIKLKNNKILITYIHLLSIVIYS